MASSIELRIMHGGVGVRGSTMCVGKGCVWV